MIRLDTVRLAGLAAAVAALGLATAGCLPLSPGTLGESCEDDSDCFQGQFCAERDGEKICVTSEVGTPDGGDTVEPDAGDTDDDTDVGDGGDTGDAGDTGDGGGDTGPSGYTVKGTISAGGYCSGTPDDGGGTYRLQGHITYGSGPMTDDDSGYSVQISRQRHRPEDP